MMQKSNNLEKVSKIGHAIEKCTSLIQGMVIKIRNYSCKEDAIKLLKVFPFEWTSLVLAVGLETLGTNKFNQMQLIVITEDLLSVQKFMKDCIGINTKAS